MLNIVEENLHCHHLLFIHDVVTSKYNVEQDTFEVVETGLVYRNVRLNGVLVSRKQHKEEEYLWLDDGTAVIKVRLLPPLFKRKAYEKLASSVSVTIVGKLKKRDKEIMVDCLGFQVHEQGIDELYHLLKVIQERPKQKKEKLSGMFHSLSSEPSPKRLDYVPSPIRDHPPGFIWSPTHTVATSTPLRASVMRQRQESEEEEDEFEFSDLGDIDLIALEANAIKQNQARNE
ncbi:hypothetical protein G6F46_001007 [Rhizopus delemar]|nr:hypothetical protein G6F55_009516 [Rhizopus delemar]KAG1551495.1 hypothetical protein G6F51_001809 [Rhizopus arrhizus]KAG1501032.1 hypothetical protein G6F54_003313 [Rhizopus delemar]KAG1512880.1 hypothetical protein G6F52_010303 [Rhizopus delemar]KAG1515449.1 hypothetical protein G6F53_002915 [Rhizopus delemar]